MKTKHLLLGFVATIIVAGSSFFYLKSFQQANKKYVARDNAKIMNEEYGAAGAAQWIFDMKKNPKTGTISSEDIAQSRKDFESLEMQRGSNAVSMKFEFMGPDDVGGRTRAFLIDKDDPNVLYAGGVAGGIWKSITRGRSWVLLSSDMDNLSISSICQTSNGDIYIGTGEYYSGYSGSKESTNGFPGQGIWKSTDGKTFTHLSGTETYSYVNELVVDPTHPTIVYAATNKGVIKSTNGGASWDNAFGKYGVASDIKISSKGVFLFDNNRDVYISTNGTSATKKTGTDSGEIPHSFNRLEFAISPSDPNYMYAFCSYPSYSSGNYFQLYQSKDGGNKWYSVIEYQSSSIMPFGANNQGYYDNTIAVFPDDPGKVLFGGIDLWTWSSSNGFEKISYWRELAGYKFVHADQHTITFDPDYTNNKIIYFTNDGGIFTSSDGGFSFKAINKDYGVTQYYGIDCGGNGSVLGGCQDNGTPFIDKLIASDPKSSWEMTGGDGGQVAVSKLYPGAVFSTVYYSQLYRSNENGDHTEYNPYESYMNSQCKPGNSTVGNPFVTPIDLWESFDYDSSKIYFPYIIDTMITEGVNGKPDTITSFKEGSTIIIPSSTINYKSFERKITAEDITNNGGAPLKVGDTLVVREKFAHLFAVGFNKKLFFTRNILNFKVTPTWEPLVGIDRKGNSINTGLGLGMVRHLRWSKDGNNLFASSDGDLFRFSNIKEAYHYTGYVYVNRILTKDTVYNVNANDIDTAILVHTNPNVWKVDTGSTPYITNVIKLDTLHTTPDTVINIITQDTTYKHEDGDDMVWRKEEVNTMDSIHAAKIAHFSGIITDIATDPKNPERVLVAIGGYGSGSVYESTTAASCPASGGTSNFTQIKTGLPSGPVYAVSILDTANIVLAGTDYGLYAAVHSSGASSISWERQTTIPKVPVFSIVQEYLPQEYLPGVCPTNITNSGSVYIGTHGMGAWKCDTYQRTITAIKDVKIAKVDALSVKIYPNPVKQTAHIEYNLPKEDDVQINIYSLNGKLIYQQTYKNQWAGKHTQQIDATSFNKGVYIISLTSSTEQKVSKFIVE